MAIAGTYVFNPDIGEIMEEAFERVPGAEFQNADHIRTARRSLNLIALKWQNKGINLWTVEEQSIPASTIVAGTHTYNVDIDTIGILDAVIRTNSGDTSLQSDLTITMMSFTSYSQITNKLVSGRPVQYVFNRTGIKEGTTSGSDQSATITLWPVPEASNKYSFIYWRMKRSSDVGNNLGNTVQMPDRFIPALISALAYSLSGKIPSAALKMDKLKAEMEEDWREAAEEDRERVDFYIHPDMTAYR